MNNDFRNIAFKATLIFASLFIVLIFHSCHPAKHVPEGEYLLRNVEFNYDADEISERELNRTLRQKPNKKTLSVFRFHLFAYNLAKSGRERGWKNRIAEVVGEPPVIFDNFAREQTERNISSYLQTQGFYQSEVSSDVNFRKRSVKVTYNINANRPHILSQINYNISDLEILNIIDEDLDNTLLEVGDNFNTDVLQKERERLVRLLKTKGFFYFSINNIHFYVDTIREPYKANITLAIRKSFEEDRIDLDDRFVQQKINNVYIYTNYDANRALEDFEAYSAEFDTIFIDGIHLIYRNDLKIRPEIFLQSCFVWPGDLYNIKNVELTNSHLTNLRQFRMISIRMRKPEDSLIDPEQFLDCHIYLTPLVKQSYTVELEGMNSSGNIGAAGGLTWNNRNLFRGAEILSVKGSVSLQSMLSHTEETDRFLNTFESSAEVRLNIPKLIVPFIEGHEFTKKHNPNTRLTTSFSYQQRPDYVRGIGTATYGYMWRGNNRHFTHFFNPLELHLVRIFEFNPDFYNEIKNLYIRYSYENQLITVASYDLLFNNQNIHRRENFTYFWLNLETSGNLMNGIYNITNQEPIDGSYKFFGVEFAQFVKADMDFRYYIMVDDKRSLVYRTFFGIGLPYGNSTRGLPFIKRYFTGGANDLRAWQVRNLGPGSYSEGLSYNQIADMKMVFNLEYRFPVVSFLEGALFLDAGNIWAIDSNDDREGALFEWDRFYKEIALGTGIGTRLDFSFFVIRFDFGVPLYDPKFPEEDRWLRTFKDLKFRDLTFNFGIGYPF